MVAGKIFLLMFMLSSKTDMKEIRSLFIQASSDKEKTKELMMILSNPENNNKTMLGYKGSVTILMAKHSFNPYHKLKYFTNGKELLEHAIREDKNNIELRFLRYAIQNNVPSILGYKENLSEDRKFIVANFHSVYDDNLKKMIRSLFNNI